MRTLFVLFDSLNRRALSCYGGDTITPNFTRLAQRSIVFDNHYVGSLPCMPARRDMHTGRLNFLHRSWGPLEPFDVSYPEILNENGTYTHLVTDHYHYFEDGGSTYHNRYTTWEFLRGQEWDPFRAVVEPPLEKFKAAYHPSQYEDHRGFSGRLQNMINREYVRAEEDYALAKCFDRLIGFLDTNGDAGDWLVQIECFDPHEPFAAPARFRDLYPRDYKGPVLDWPRYKMVDEDRLEVEELRANYAALVTMCDAQLGRLLDHMDAHNLWHDTAVVLSTDHGFMLGEHDWWAKNRQPFYQEIAHIPLIIYHPDFADRGGERRQALTQTTDIMPTLLHLHGAETPPGLDGRSLVPVLAQDQEVHAAVIYGLFGAATNVTDGRYTYFRYPDNMATQELWEYTLMPTHLKSFFKAKEFENASLERSFSFLRGYPVLKLPARRDAQRPPGQGGPPMDARTVLYDLAVDPQQLSPIDDDEIESRMVDMMVALMRANEAPPEAYARLGLAVPA